MIVAMKAHRDGTRTNLAIDNIKSSMETGTGGESRLSPTVLLSKVLVGGY